MGTVLISYSSKDRVFALRLATDLTNIGHNLWIDIWNLTGQTPFFWDEIQNAIHTCSYFLFIISPDSLDPYSGALKELYYALSLKPSPIITLTVAENRPVSYSILPLVISPNYYQIYDFTKQTYDDMFKRLSSALHPALTTINPVRGTLFKAIFTEGDFEELADLLKRSGRVSGNPARTALCNSLGIDPGEIDITGNDRDFSINFIAYIYRSGNLTALDTLCKSLISLLHGILKLKLEKLHDKINNLNP